MNVMSVIENNGERRHNFLLCGHDPLAPPLLRILAAAHQGSFPVALRALVDLMLTARRAGVFSIKIEERDLDTSRYLEDLASAFDLWRDEHPDQDSIDG